VTITRCFVVKEKVQGELINETHTHTHTEVCFLISFLVRGDYQFFSFFFFLPVWK
jgi:hypothetical protein